MFLRTNIILQEVCYHIMWKLATPIVGIVVYNAIRFWFNFSHTVNIYLLLATMQ